MDPPPVQYAKTADGVSIAFTVTGHGPPLVIPPPGNSHVQLEWVREAQGGTYSALADRATVIRYDHRGTGMSQRDRIDCSMEAAVADINGVVDKIGVERFAIFANLPGASLIPFAYAAHYPERVSHLALYVSPMA